MMFGAKEGNRTPTRVTPLEPEGTAPISSDLSCQRVTVARWVGGRPQKAARNSKRRCHCGACTDRKKLDFDRLANAQAAAFWKRLRVPSWLYSAAEGQSGRTAGEVYFIEAIGAERVKVGWSRDVVDRIDRIQVGCPFPLRILLAVSGTEQTERHLHEQRLVDAHAHGEWFHAPAVRELIGGGLQTLYFPRQR